MRFRARVYLAGNRKRGLAFDLPSCHSHNFRSIGEFEMLKGFKEFLLRGNVIDLAIAVVIGTAFVAIVTAFSENVINPLIAALGGSGGIGWGFKILSDNDKTFVDIGAVITAAINFVLIAAIVYFVLVLPVVKIKERRKAAGDDAEALTDSEVLVQIRDLLAGESGPKGLDPE